MYKNTTICTICVRGGSKGILNKNIRTIAGKPLVAHSIDQAIKSNLFSHVVISTDFDEIAEIGKKYGAEVFFKRPQEMSEDSSSKLPAIRHAFIESEKHFNTKFDFLVDLDATSPLRMTEDIIKAFKQFIGSDNDNLITACVAKKSPYFNLIELDEQKVPFLSKPLKNTIDRRQDSPKCYDMNASIYIWKRDVILNKNTIFNEKTGVFIMPEERSIDIDSQLDFDLVSFLMTQVK